MQIDSFIQLINNLSNGQINDDDTDPSNIVLQVYASPFDEVAFGESVRVMSTSNNSARVWGDGTTYTATDTSGNPYQAPSCGWLWGTGGRWG